MAQQTKIFGQREVIEALKIKELPPPPPKHFENKRKLSQRSRQLKNVQIIFNNGYCTFDAILRDLSDDGARIDTKHVLEIPDVFTLKSTYDNTTKKCRLIWRGKESIGALFITSSLVEDL